MSASSDYKIFNLHDQSQIEVKKIIVVGNDRTKLVYFQNELNQQMHSVAAVKTSPNSYKLPFAALYSNLHSFTGRLLSSDLFDVADTNLQIDNFNADEHKFEATLKISVKEKGIPFLRTQSYVRAGRESEVGAELTGALRNPLGLGDQWKISTISKQQGSREFLASVTFPHIANTSDESKVSIPTEQCRVPNIFDISPSCPLTVSVKSCTENASGLGPFKLSNTSFSVDYNYPNNKHLWSLEYSIRDEIPFLDPSRAMNSNGNTNNKSGSSHGLWKDIIPQSTLWVTSPFSLSDKPSLSSKETGSSGNFEKGQVPSANDSIHPVFMGLLSSSIKSSLKYVFTPFDTRDSAAHPTRGSFLQSQLELATYPGNTHFLKAELLSQYHKTFYPFPGNNQAEKGVTFSLAGNLGLLFPIAYYATKLWNGIFEGEQPATNGATMEHDSHHHSSHALPRASYLSDRFFAGGPLSLRGFNLHGVGPRASHTINHHHYSHQSTANHVNRYDNNGLSLGGDSRSAFLAMVTFPLPQSWTTPLLRSLQFRTLYFLNVGTLGNSDYWSWQHLHPTTKKLIADRLPNRQHNNSHVQGLLTNSLFGHLRASVGTGVSCNLGSAIRLEATYSVPLMYNAHDVLHPFQFGIGVSVM